MTWIDVSDLPEFLNRVSRYNRVAAVFTALTAILTEQYYASPKFQSLAESTRKVRRGILEEICQRAGNFRYAMMETPHVAKLRDEKGRF